MSESPDNDFQEDPVPDGPVNEAPALADALIVDVDGYEGPLDVLLVLAKAQKSAARLGKL